MQPKAGTDDPGLPLSPIDALMEIAVQFAGDQAVQANEDTDFEQGALEVHDGVLTADLDQREWKTTYGTDSGGDHTIAGVADLVEGILSNVLNVTPQTTVGGVKADNVINDFVKTDAPSEIDVALEAAAAIDATGAAISYESHTANTILVGQSGTGTIKAGDGNNLVFGGQTVTVGNGDNIIVGEAGGETITVGGGNNVVIASGSGNTINIEASASDPKIPGINFLYAGNGAENINIDSGNGQAGVIVDPVTNFSKNALLDLDQSALKTFLNQQLSSNSWQNYENSNSNGLGIFDWTVLLVNQGQQLDDNFTINGSAITLSTQYGTAGTSPIPYGFTGTDDINGTFGERPGGIVFSYDYGAININLHIPSSVDPISLTQYLTKDEALIPAAKPESRFAAEFSRSMLADPSSDDATISISVFDANQTMLDERFGTISISDSADNISSDFDALQNDGHIGSVTITDAGTPVLQLDASQVFDDANTLSLITNASYTIAVTDTAANVSTQLDALDADPTVTSIVLTDAGTPMLTLSAVQALGDTAALGAIVGPYTVGIYDTAADVAANLDALNADAHVSTITLADSGTPTLALDVAQILGDRIAIGEISDLAYAINVQDTATSILANEAALGSIANVASQTVIDTATNVIADADALETESQVSSISIVDTAANVLTNAAALQGIAKISSITVVDQAANILGDAEALQSDAQITEVAVSDTAANILNKAVALAADNAISAVFVSDSAADVSANIDALNADANITQIDLTDASTPVLVLIAAQALDDGTALSEIGNATASIDIVDTAADVSANIDALNSDTQISSVTLTGTTTPTLVLTAAQATGDTTVLSLVANASLTVSDNAADVAADLDELNAAAWVTSIALSDGGTPTLTLTAQQAVSDTAALGKISPNFTIAVADRAANVVANLDALMANSQVSSITLTDVEDPTLNLSADQALNDTDALSEITNASYAISVTDTVANLSANEDALSADQQVSAINISDTAGNILADNGAIGESLPLSGIQVADTAADVSADFDALEDYDYLFNFATYTPLARISSITLTDTATLALTASEAVYDTDLLDDISNPGYSVSVVDTTSGIESNIDALNVDSRVTSISVDDSDAPVLSLTAAQAIDDTTALNEITNTTYSIEVVDSAAGVAAQLDALNGDASVASIVLTDYGLPTLTLTAAQAANDTNALAEIAVAYQIAVVDTAAGIIANAGEFAGNPNVASVSVVDSAAAVLSNAADLTAISQITSITVVDSVSDVVADATVLNADPGISSVIVSGTAADALEATAALSEVGALSAVEVVDTGENVATQIDALDDDREVTSIFLADPPSAVASEPQLTLTASQATGDTVVLGKIVNPSYSIAIEDTASDISKDLIGIYDALDVFYDGPHEPISSITLTDPGAPVLDLNAYQYLFEFQYTVGRLITNDGYSVTLTDSVADFARYEFYFDGGNFYSVNIADSAAAVATYFSQPDSDPRLPGSLSSVSVVDNAEGVSENIDALNNAPLLSSITLTDVGTPVLTLTTTQAFQDSRALSLIRNAFFSVDIHDTAENILSDGQELAADPYIASVDVYDTAQDVLACQSQLASDSLVAAINVVGTPPITVDAAQASRDASALARIQGASIDVTDTAANILAAESPLDSDAFLASINVSDTAADVAADAEALADDPQITSITVSDTAANIVASSAALEALPIQPIVDVVDSADNVAANLVGLYENPLINAINLTDSGTPTIELTAAEAGMTSELNKIDSPAYNVAIVDSAANVSANFTTIYTDTYYGTVNSITLTDSATPTLDLSFVQAVFEQSVLSDITNPSFDIAVNDVAYWIGNYGSYLADDPFVTAVNVNDTAADVAIYIDQLNADSQLTSINLTDPGAPQLVLSAEQVLDDTTALGKISNADFSIAVEDSVSNVLSESDALSSDSAISSIGVADTATNILINSTVLNSDALISSQTVSDYTSNISSNIDALNSDAAISSIDLLDGPNSQSLYGLSAPTLDITSSQIGIDAVALGKIDNSSFVLNSNNNNISLGMNDTITVAGTGNTLVFSQGDGSDAIGAGDGTNIASAQFGSGTSPQDLWFEQAGDNLQIDIMGTKDSLTIDNWFGGTPAAVQSFTTPDGSTLDSQVGQLVSAMATYSANNPGFDPTATSQAPAETTLQTTIAASWHH